VAINVVNILPSGINSPLFQKALTRLGVEPRPPPPVYAPELVARAIVHAARSPMRDIVVGGGGWALALAHRLSPRLADAILQSPVGFEGQLTDKPKSPRAPSNLFDPSPASEARVEGLYGAESLRRSLFTRMMLTPVAAGARWMAQAIFGGVARLVAMGWRASLPRAARRSLVRRLVQGRRRRAPTG
jgi:hypothetical protein